MMIGMVVVTGIDGRLPFTETLQRIISVMTDVQSLHILLRHVQKFNNAYQT